MPLMIFLVNEMVSAGQLSCNLAARYRSVFHGIKYMLRTLRNGLKHRETTKNTTGKQGKSVLLTEH